MKTELVLWEKELESLNNALISLKLEGYKVYPNHNGFRKRTTFYLTDDTQTSITGSWKYEQLNHFIMGYGKALQKPAAAIPGEIPTAEEFLKNFAIEYGQFHVDDTNKVYAIGARKFTELHLQAALKAAADNVTYDLKTFNHPEDGIEIDKDSILNAYPLSLIK